MEFKLVKINTLQFAAIELPSDNQNTPPTLSANFRFGQDAGNKGLIVMAKFQFDQKGNPFLIVEVSCEFMIGDSTWAGFSVGETVAVPKAFMAHLMMIATGTTRGVLHSKTENTSFNKFILPAINVSEMLEGDVVFQI